MNVLHVVPSLAPVTGGPAKSVPALVELLRKRGIQASLVTTDFLGIPQDQVALRIFRHEGSWWLGGLPRSPSLLAWLGQEVDKYDVVHVHSLWNPVATFAMQTLRRAGVPYAVSPRGMLDPTGLGRSRLRKCLWAWMWERPNIENAGVVHFTSKAEESKARLTRWGLQSTVVIPNSVGVPPVGGVSLIESKRPIILYAGRLSWVKNLGLLVEAMKRVDAELVLAGPDTEGLSSNLQRRARELGIADRIKFLGLLDSANLSRAYRDANVVVLPSKQESFGMVLAEALAAGTPVVASEGVDLAADWPSDGAAAIRVPTTVEGIAAGIREQLKRKRPDPEAVAIAKRWTDPELVRPLEEAYERLLKSRL